MSASEAAQSHLSNSFFSASLADSDPEIARAIGLELGRQRDEIELIASENIVSRAVLEAQGSVMTNKYAEGYPGRRYYGGCQFVDMAEELAIERAKRLFDCKFANVQPHSGATANQAVFFALLQPGDKFLGMDLACGGHLTHGSPVNVSGKWFHPVAYGVREDDHLIDYEEVAEIARRAGVTRLTVYNHFPELSDLLPACAAHYESLHPAPEFEPALALGDPGDRVHAVLTLLYAWYRETESMYGNLMSDRASVPELDRFLEQNLDRMLAELAEDLAAAFALRGRRAERLRALVRLALDFWTWRRLTREGVDDETAADLMASAVSANAA